MDGDNERKGMMKRIRGKGYGDVEERKDEENERKLI